MVFPFASVTWVRWGSLTSDGGLQQLQLFLTLAFIVFLSVPISTDSMEVRFSDDNVTPIIAKPQAKAYQ